MTYPRITARSIQIALGFFWILDGLLQLQPHMFTQSFVTNVLQPAAHGQPGWLTWLVNTNARVIGTHAAPWNLIFALVQLLIGAGLLVRSTVKPALALSFVWSLGVWALGEGMGMILTSGASPLMGAPGAVLLYGLIGAMVWPRSTHRVPAVSAGSVRAASHGLFGDLGARAAWAAVWVGYAVMWLLPSNSGKGGISKSIATMASGQPGWLGHIMKDASSALSNRGPGLALLLALASFAIGVAPLYLRSSRVFYVAGAVLALAFWVFGQAFGGILTGPANGTATDPNTGPLIVLMALALLPVSQIVRQSPAHQPTRSYRHAWEAVMSPVRAPSVAATPVSGIPLGPVFAVESHAVPVSNVYGTARTSLFSPPSDSATMAPAPAPVQQPPAWSGEMRLPAPDPVGAAVG